MLARGPVQMVAQRHHLTAPDSHALEVVSAGTNLNFLVPINGILQEAHIRLGVPTPFFLDSKSAVFVSNNDASAKKSVWIRRRVAVLHEGIEHDEIKVTHIGDLDMVADIFTKYLPYGRWKRHKWYLLNLPGDPPPG